MAPLVNVIVTDSPARLALRWSMRSRFMVNKAEAEDCRACVAIGKVVVVTFLFPLLVVMDEEGTGGPIPGGGLGAVVAVAVFSGRAQALAARGVVVVLALLLLVVVSAISILDVVGEAHTHKRARERPKKIMQDIMVGVRRGRKKTARHGPILHPKKQEQQQRTRAVVRSSTTTIQSTERRKQRPKPGSGAYRPRKGMGRIK